MNKEIEWFGYAFKECPYCKSKNITEPSYEDKTCTILGAHIYAELSCKDCDKTWATSNQEMINWQIPAKNIKNENVIQFLKDNIYIEGNKSERLDPSDFENNDHYKVTYRFLANMLSGWKEKGFKSFSTIEKVIEIAKKVDPYFVWLLNNETERYVFTNNYDFMKDVWE